MKKKHTFYSKLWFIGIVAMFLLGNCEAPLYPEIDKPDPTRSGINDILSFQLDLSQFAEYQEGDEAIVTIFPEADSISIQVPWYTGIIMAPTITVSPQATVAPISGSVRDFSQGTLIYTVRANNGEKKEWKVYVAWLDEPEPPLSDDPRRPLEETDKYTIHKIPVYSNAYTISGSGMSLSSSNGITWTTSGATGLGSIYFNVRYHGELQLALRGSSGNTASGAGNTLRVRIYINGEQYVENGVPYDHEYIYNKRTMATDTLTLHRIHLPAVPPGHAGHTVRIDLSVVGARSGSQYYFRFPEFWASGWATRGTGGSNGTGLNWVPLSNEHFGRRGPSVHIRPDKPAGNMEYFYSEVYIPEGQDQLGSYFMCNGFGEGYAGIQVNSSTERRVLFSVWSAFTTDVPSQTGKYMPRKVRVNNDEFRSSMTYQTFGGEGSGGQSYIRYMWEAGKTYKMLTRVRPHPQPEKFPNSSLYKTWFHNGDKWIFIAEWRRIELDPADNNGVVPTTKWYTNAYHFLENFTVEEGNKTRYGTWGNDWYIGADGTWYECTDYNFTNDATAQAGDRVDYAGGVLPAGDPQAGAVFLKMGGYFTENVRTNTRFVKPAFNNHPEIDFTALNAMGTDTGDSALDSGEQYEE
jgi:hypothetical protein